MSGHGGGHGGGHSSGGGEGVPVPTPEINVPGWGYILIMALLGFLSETIPDMLS